jgi:membrane protease subunit (stomatin/prohibitin family)
MSLEYTVFCDGSIMAADTRNAAEARKDAAASDWRAVNRGRQDFCAECNERRTGDARFNRRTALKATTHTEERAP